MRVLCSPVSDWCTPHVLTPLRLPRPQSWMYSFITDNLLASYVLPDHYFYPMVPTAPDYNIPVGIIEVTVVECKCELGPP